MSRTPKIILFNGPPYSGKDTAAEYIAKQYQADHRKFAYPLKAAIPAFFDKDPDFLELNKDRKYEELFNYSYRDLLISLSEEWAKEKFGINVFGKILANRIMADRVFAQEQNIIPAHTVISDSGFKDEAQVLVNRFGAENIILCRVHRLGCNFDNDSRDYVYLDGVQSFDLINNGEDLSEYHDYLTMTLKGYL